MSGSLLAVAILAEVGGTLALRMAALGRRIWLLPVAVGYLVAFTALGLTLSAGMSIGVAYGIWTATGVALTALAGRVLFHERLTWVMGLGIVLIIGGVVLIEAGNPGH